MAVFTAPWFLAEVRGCSKLYLDPNDYGWWYMVVQFPLFLVFTDGLIYLIHRGLHHPLVYKTLHKPHHRWIVPTPFASHAFHPLDGYSQVLSPQKPTPLSREKHTYDSLSHTTSSHSSSHCKSYPTYSSSPSSNSGRS